MEIPSDLNKLYKGVRIYNPNLYYWINTAKFQDLSVSEDELDKFEYTNKRGPYLKYSKEFMELVDKNILESATKSDVKEKKLEHGK